MPERPFISVVIPCFNEEAVLENCYDRVSAVCNELGHTWELILVDDGSRDKTWSLLASIAAQDPHVVAIHLSRNFGHQAALSCGLNHTVGEYVLILDADLQDPPELLSEMLVPAQEGFDIVYGVRKSRAGESLFKKLSASVFYRFLNYLSDIEIPRNTGDFRLLSRRAVEAFKQLPEHSRFIRGMFSWVGFRQCPFPYSRQERLAGTTKYSLRKMLSFAVDGITGFSIRPLKIALLLAFIMAFFALLGAGWTVWSWIQGGTVRGWASVLVASFIIGSCQLFVLGIIGEYLGRLFMEAKRRPAYLVDTILHERNES
ncbi:glycosyltransferase family 2 protein [Coraliomargarita parva]|uniref:glycosyltransferase family 2 protein n=1 Tax=Coraliomargarita parva TaxID=3014050 RepID=UPI0022B52D4A|nr:glycosyltransferase family 2 protein [Coraliomargarita parva]